MKVMMMMMMMIKTNPGYTLFVGVPRWQPHRRLGSATLPSVGAVP